MIKGQWSLRSSNKSETFIYKYGLQQKLEDNKHPDDYR